MVVEPEQVARCEFKCNVFASFGDVRFRRSDTDGASIMAIALGEREAQLPLAALRREFGIADDSPDARMLELIDSALDYVPSLAPGDRLPSEIVTGEASWQPGPDHFRLAATRVRLDLVAWLLPTSRFAISARDEATLLRLADDLALQEEVRTVAIPAASKLDLRGAARVLNLVEEMSHELAYVEALRQRVLNRVEALCRRLSGLLTRQRRVGPSDTLAQVHRLAWGACKQLHERFDDVDAQTGEFSSMMRNVANFRQFIRTNRDWLYRNQRFWEPLLTQWDQLDSDVDDVPALLSKSYQVLAPRFMPTQQWTMPGQQRAGERTRVTGSTRPQMAW